MLLAVSTPRSIELNEDILLNVHSNLLEVLSNQDLDSLLVPILGDILRHQMLLQFSVHEVSNKLVVLRLVFSHVLAKLDGSVSWQLRLGDAEELQNSLVVLFVGIDGDEQHLALVVLCQGSQFFQLLLVVVSLGGGEHQEVGLDLAREDLLGGLVVKINDQRQGLGADETGNILLSQVLSQGSLALVECLDNDDTLRGDSVL